MNGSGRVLRFFKTPKGLLLLILVLLVGIAAPHEGLRTAMPGVLSAVLGAGLVDALILRLRSKRHAWEFPSGAVLTALIVAMVLRAQEPWHVTTITSIAAVLSKYLLRTRSANVFNPAALAIVASFYVFHTGQSWWGALPEVPPLAQLVLLAAGVFIADRVNKMPLVLVFLGAYFILFTATAFVSDPRHVAEVFRAPDLHAALFFAFIILTDPPTSPAKYPDQIVCGVLVAVVSYAVFEWLGAVYYLLAGVLVGNVWEAWRRSTRHTRKNRHRMVSVTKVGVATLLLTMTASAEWNLMPLPSSIRAEPGALAIRQDFRIMVAGPEEARVNAAATRLMRRIERRTGMPLAPGSAPTLTVRISSVGNPVQSLDEDESYRLVVNATRAEVSAPNPLGAMHGLETFLQLIDNTGDGWTVPAVTIEDHPRFAWRGLHLDVSRHFMPLDVVRRNIDGMAAVKLNVFHWHLSDDQGFRVESKRFPKLHELGSDDLFYTQDDVRAVVRYARERGIRVVPEFDIPGHAASWLVGYPELAAAPGPFEIIRKWGVFDPNHGSG